MRARCFSRKRSPKLFRNLGSISSAIDCEVKFDDQTRQAGLANKSGPGLGILCADFDGDLWQDLFVANDGAPNHLWINQKDGSFKEQGVLSGLAYNAMGQAEANMGIAIGDVDGDQLFDLFVTHLHEESHRLWKQSPVGSFNERTAAVGLMGPSSKSTGFGTLLGDFDNDGDIDLVIANGMVRRDTNVAPSTKVEDFWEPYRQVNYLYSNEGSGKFKSRLSMDRDLCGVPGVWRGVVCGDLDNDGGLDLVVTRLDGKANIFRNTVANRGNWMLISALDQQRHAYGAVITLVAGAKKWTRWLNPGQGFACSSDPRAHFGIGSTDRVDEILVVWPDGSSETFPGRNANQLVELQKRPRQPNHFSQELTRVSTRRVSK